MALNEMQTRFAFEYVVDFNATKAAMRAGYSEKSAYQQGHELLKNLEIQALIEENKQKYYDEALINRDKVLRLLAHQAFADPNSFYREGANGVPELVPYEELNEAQRKAIKSFRITDNQKDGRKLVGYNLYDRERALDMINKMCGFDAPQKIDINADVTNREATPEDDAALKHYLQKQGVVLPTAKQDDDLSDIC